MVSSIFIKINLKKKKEIAIRVCAVMFLQSAAVLLLRILEMWRQLLLSL